MWQVATDLTGWRLVLAVVVSIGATTAWVIVHHRLWEPPRQHVDREEAWFYNGATVVTILLGVICMAAFVFVANLAAALFVLDTPVLGASLGRPAGFDDILALAAFATSAATIAGAVGCSLETEDSVRRAAYGYRERCRRAEQDDRLPH